MFYLLCYLLNDSSLICYSENRIYNVKCFYCLSLGTGYCSGSRINSR